jgi:hypothetical protein
LKEARGPMLTAHIAEQARAQGWYERIALRPRRHLEAARRTCASQQHMVRWEVGQIERALGALDVPVVLLKGSAYVMAGLPAAEGRVFSDIDIMVPRSAMHRAETALIPHGWISNANAYDRRYYEKWMHELPALQHVQRSSVIDLHHTITPPTSRTPVDAAKLFEAARPLAGSKLFFVLAPWDMVLHSAVHLIQEGEFWHGLRDLVDLDALLRDFGGDAGFWPALLARAGDLGLGRPLYYAMQQALVLLKTPMPAEFIAGLERFRPAFLTRRVMARLLGTALAGASAGASARQIERARWFLYVRGHYVRMPLKLLIPHLVRKGGVRLATLCRRRADDTLPVGGERTAN